MKNKYGLSRYIPEDIREQVRKRSGYGCIVCRKIPYDYDHFQKSYVESKIHDPDDIILLCPNHHRAKENGQLSPAKIQLRIEQIKKGDPQYLTELLSDYFNIFWPANNIFSNFSSGIKINGKPVFEVTRTGDKFDPVHFSFVIKDRKNETICVVKNNAFEFREDKIRDLILEGSNLKLKDENDEYILDLEILHLGIYIKRLKIIQDGCYILADKTSLIVGNSDAHVAINNVGFASEGREPHEVISVWQGSKNLKFDTNSELILPKRFFEVTKISFIVPEGRVVFDIGNPNSNSFIVL